MFLKKPDLCLPWLERIEKNVYEGKYSKIYLDTAADISYIVEMGLAVKLDFHKKILLNVFKCLTVSGLSLQFLLRNNTFSFTSVGVLCEFGIV